MKTSNPILLVAAVVLLGIFAMNWLNPAQNQRAPEIAFTDIDGLQHALTQYKQKPVLMIFWATDCPGCVKEMPELNALYRDYANQGLAMIGVAMPHDTPEHITAMREQRQLPYTLTWDEEGVIAQAFNNVRVTPTHFLIAPNGEIVMRKIGELNFEQLREKLHDMGLTPA